MEKDSVLVQRSLQGDKDAYGELVTKYQGAVYGLCFHLVGNFADAQDLAQEAFIRAYLDLRQLREPDKFASWLYSVTTNICKMWLRKRRTEIASLDEVAHEVEFSSEFPSPHETVERKEGRLAVQRAIASLSEKNRLVVTLYYMDGLSYQEISNFLDVPVSTIKSRLHRARLQLKERLITMVQETFERQKLPDDFAEKIGAVLNQFMSEKITYDDALKSLSHALESLRDDVAFESYEEWHQHADEPYASFVKLTDDRMAVKAAYFLEKAFFHNDETALLLVERAVKQGLIVALEDGEDGKLDWTGSRDNLINIMDLLSLSKDESFVMGNPIASYQYGEIGSRKEGDGIRVGGGSSNLAVVNETIQLGPPVKMEIFPFKREFYPWKQVIMFDVGTFKVPFPPAKIGLKEQFPIPEIQFQTTLIIESDSETVTTPSGTYTNCLKMRKEISRGQEDKEYSLTELAWFAPGVGLVRVKNSLFGIDASLIEFSGERIPNSYLPIGLGMKWVYQWRVDNIACKQIVRTVRYNVPAAPIEITFKEDPIRLRYACLYIQEQGEK